MTELPPPLISASIYGQKQHDLLLDAFIRPFWEASSIRGFGGLWTMRYGAGGEHLKIRIHGPKHLETETRQQLASTLDRFVEFLPPAEPEGVKGGFFPAIDPEDEEEVSRPDRFWRWTTYRPSAFVLGAEKLAQDPTLNARYAHAQCAVAEVVMKEVSPQRLEPSFATARQSLFVRMLITSLPALFSSEAAQEAYLRHHRDWLIRFLIAKAKAPEASPDTILKPLRERITTMRPTLDVIRQRLNGNSVGSAEDATFGIWRQRLLVFFSYASTFRGNLAYDLDPYASDYAFLPLFKLLHGACNQFGLRLSNELYVYQLLLAATTTEA